MRLIPALVSRSADTSTSSPSRIRVPIVLCLSVLMLLLGCDVVSGTSSVSAGGIDYEMKSAIGPLSSTSALPFAKTQIVRVPGTLGIPTGFAGARAMMFRDGTLVSASDIYFTSGPTPGMTVGVIPPNLPTGTHNYFSRGQIWVWHGNGYWSYPTLRTPNLTYPT